jgi:CheY-like chemotaxis protein
MNPAKTVLIIEDETKLRRTVAAYLEDSGYQVLEAVNGREGVERITQHRPDLVLTDLRMPEMNGLEVVAWIQRHSPQTPVIVVSGTGDQQAVDTSLAAGAKLYLTKPIADLAELEIAIRKVLT